MSEPVVVQYRGVAIHYDESDNRWRLDLRGREKSAESLVEAKKIVDTPVKEKVPPFERVKVYSGSRWGSEPFEIVEVTSVAERTRYSTSMEVWLSVGDKRRKQSTNDLFLINERNTTLIAEHVKLEEEITARKKRQSAIERGLDKYTVQPEVTAK